MFSKAHDNRTTLLIPTPLLFIFFMKIYSLTFINTTDNKKHISPVCTNPRTCMFIQTSWFRTNVKTGRRYSALPKELPEKEPVSQQNSLRCPQSEDCALLKAARRFYTRNYIFTAATANSWGAREFGGQKQTFRRKCYLHLHCKSYSKGGGSRFIRKVVMYLSNCTASNRIGKLTA